MRDAVQGSVVEGYVLTSLTTRKRRVHGTKIPYPKTECCAGHDKSGSYLGLQCVDNSRVEQQHRHIWQCVCENKDRPIDGLLCSIAGEYTPRYARSFDDVGTQTTGSCQKRWQNDPNNHDSKVHQTLLNFELQNVHLHYT